MTNEAQDALAEEGRHARLTFRRFLDFWYGFELPHGLAVFRIGIGVYLLASWLPRLPYVELYYSSEGMVFPLVKEPEGSIDSMRAFFGWLTNPPPEPLIAWLLYGLTVASIALFTIGWWARPALAVFCALMSYWYLLQLHSLESSFDRLIWVSLVLLAMGRCDAVYSLRASARARRGEPALERIPIWPQRAIELQFVTMYVGTGIYKVLSPAWDSGEMLAYSMQGDWTTDVSFWVLGLGFPWGVYDVIVLQTILMEVTAPFWLFHRTLQKLFFAWGIVFHIAIAVILSIWQFFVMPISYVLFLDPATVKALVDRLFGQR